jgi:multiple sugar transport system substrate-binding protein
LKMKMLWIVLMLSFSIAITGCTSNAGTDLGEPDTNDENNESASNEEEGDNNASGSDEAPEEVTIVWANDWDYDMNVTRFKEPIEEALPHITLEIVESVLTADEPGTLEELIAAQSIPDIFYFSGAGHTQVLKDYDLSYDLEELFEKYNFDLSRIDDGILNQIRNETGGLYGISLRRHVTNLYYNKDIFDMFGAPYPTDHMTWDEVIDLAAQVTGEHDGTHYYGFDIMMPSIMLSQRQVTHIDPETHEVKYADEPIYRDYLAKLERLWSIPGMLPEDDPGDFIYQWGNNFLGDLNVAMSINWNAYGWTTAVAEEQGLNWDVVTQPVWEDQPDIGDGAAGFMIAVTSQAVEEKEKAIFEVIEFLLSEEYQTWVAADDGWATVLNDPDVQDALGADMDGLEGKNIESAFLLESNPGVPIEERSPYADRYEAMWDGIIEFAELETDINTFLRQVTEETEEMVREGIAKGEVEQLGVWAE